MQRNQTLFLKDLPKNMFSGFVVSLIALPLGLGLALASGAPPIAGVLTAVVGGIVVSILGGSHVTISGPGNGLVIVVLGAITTLGNGDNYQGYLYTLAAILISGVIVMALGFLKMGRLSDFFPSSAIQGMLAAIGLGILAKQFHVMLGLERGKASIAELLLSIPEMIYEFGTKLFSMGFSASFAGIIGVISFCIMLFYPKIRNRYVQLIPAPMWILLISIGSTYYYQFTGEDYPIKEALMINVPESIFAQLPFPDFSLITDGAFWSFVISLTLIASIESLLSIKAVDKLDPQSRRSNVNKDLKALGLGTILSALIGGLNVVTVIARSSVNVNNNASNRSANFFHAFFLLLFILLFQQQLERVSLTALAAILVYTGYKLATPSKFFKIAEIGKEQLLIFVVTVLVTVVSNLINGILMGIFTTIVIHLFLNKSVGVFLRNVLKPNVLGFKEEGQYVVSVKHFCSFLNFYQLKNKVDRIPENSNVIIDLSMCQFVDNTAMEGIEGYIEVFSKKGGEIEVVGLDKHGTKSEHPLAVRKLIPFSSIGPIENYLTRRQTQLQATATEHNWDYKPNKNNELKALKSFVYFKTKNLNYKYNQLFHKDNDINIFDLEYSEGEFIAKETIKATMFHVKLPFSAPVFTIDKEGLLEKLYHLAGFKDIQVANHPTFNKRFFLSGKNEKATKKFLSDELVLFLESQPYYHVESNGKALLIFKKERLLGVSEIKAMSYFGEQLLKLIEDKQ
ncbi:MAG: SulP family inorganic anion transporter [Flavobacteriaceae bacterium]|nr:SulP family inorganic anion transporter [Flavobacteriaceae bacterium]